MKYYLVAALFTCTWFLGACSALPDSADNPSTAEPYLGQTQPGDSAVLFAPGLVSVEGRYEYGMSFSPEGRELLFTAVDPPGPAVLMHFIAEDGGWVGPREVHLSDGQKAEEMEAFFAPDGRRFYFAAYDEGIDVRIWAVDRDGEGWRFPRQLGSPMADDPAFFPTTTVDGAVYYSNLTARRIFRAKVTGDSVGEASEYGVC